MDTDEDPQAYGEVMTGENKMRFAIVESGGKQYRAVEGRTIEVDRLPVEAGKQFNLERVLLMADGDEVMVGTPALNGIEVKVTVADHVRGPKIDRFKYRPKKRIRVRGGHRQQYTLLTVDFIGKPGEERAAQEPVAVVEEQAVEAEPVVEVMAEEETVQPSTKKSSSKKTDSKKK